MIDCWELLPLKQILRRGLRKNAFTVDVDLSSATEDQKDQRVGGIIPIEPRASSHQEPSIILSSPVSLPSPIATEAKDAPRVDAACQVQLSGRDSFEQEPPSPPSHIDPPPPSPPASPPPSPPQESTEEVKEPVGEETDSQSYSEFSPSEGENLDETTATAAPPPPPPAAANENDNDNDCSEAEGSADDEDSQGFYTSSFDSLSLSSKD